jgi:hypothetical protein
MRYDGGMTNNPLFGVASRGGSVNGLLTCFRPQAKLKMHIVLAVAMFSVGVAAANGKENIFNVQALYALCKAPDGSGKNILCLGYISGIADALAAEGTYQSMNPKDDSPFAICGSPSYGAMMQAFINWAEKNPKWVGPGDDAFMVGLYVDQPLGARNDPNARFGNVSRLASEGHPVEQGHGLKEPSDVVDMRSRTGFSGSPVFVYRREAEDLARLMDGTKFREITCNIISLRISFFAM